MRNKAQQGFTLIVLMTAVLALAALSAFALPSVQGYGSKAKLSEALLATSDCRLRVGQAYASGTMPADLRWGCGPGDGRYVKDMAPGASGAIHVRVQGTGDPALDQKVLTLVPYHDSATPKDPVVAAHWRSGVHKWVCEQNGPESIPLRLLPPECKG
jgi:type IV pilus assembly protein PilA